MTANASRRQWVFDGVDTTRITKRTQPHRTSSGQQIRNNGVIIAGRWKIATLGDGMNVTVSRNQGKNWRVEAYVSTLAAALNWLVNQEVRDSSINDLSAVVARIEQLKADIFGIVGTGSGK